MSMNHPHLKTLLLALLLGALVQGPQVLAASADRKLPLEIESDRKHTDYKSGQAVYEGRVIIRQGQLLLQSDKATIYLREGELERIVLEGRPATYHDRDEQGQPVYGEAQRMDYHAVQGVLTLSGKARVERAGDTLASERIVYHIETEVVDAGAGGGDRVHMVLQPRDEGGEGKP